MYAVNTDVPEVLVQLVLVLTALAVACAFSLTLYQIVES